MMNDGSRVVVWRLAGSKSGRVRKMSKAQIVKCKRQKLWQINPATTMCESISESLSLGMNCWVGLEIKTEKLIDYQKARLRFRVGKSAVSRFMILWCSANCVYFVNGCYFQLKFNKRSDAIVFGCQSAPDAFFSLAIFFLQVQGESVTIRCHII